MKGGRRSKEENHQITSAERLTRHWAERAKTVGVEILDLIYGVLHSIYIYLIFSYFFS